MTSALHTAGSCSVKALSKRQFSTVKGSHEVINSVKQTLLLSSARMCEHYKKYLLLQNRSLTPAELCN